MTTLSRGYICRDCGNSAEDENGNFTIYAPDCHDPECSRADEIGHWHTTYSEIVCNECAKKRNEKK